MQRSTRNRIIVAGAATLAAAAIGTGIAAATGSDDGPEDERPRHRHHRRRPRPGRSRRPRAHRRRHRHRHRGRRRGEPLRGRGHPRRRHPGRRPARRGLRRRRLRVRRHRRAEFGHASQRRAVRRFPAASGVADVHVQAAADQVGSRVGHHARPVRLPTARRWRSCRGVERRRRRGSLKAGRHQQRRGVEPDQRLRGSGPGRPAARCAGSPSSRCR